MSSPMTPQTYPLTAWTEDDEQVLVVGWTEDSINAATLAPIVVRADRPTTGARLWDSSKGPLMYRATPESPPTGKTRTARRGS